MDTNMNLQGQPGAIREGIRKRFAQVAGIFLFQAAVLFLASGDLKWTWAWIFLFLNAAGIAVNVFLLRNGRDRGRRARSKG
jgi:hypothetical protein